MAETPESHLSPSSAQLKKQYHPHPHCPTQQYQKPGQPPGQTNDVDRGLAMRDSQLQKMEESADAVRAPQMVSHPTAVFSVQSHLSGSSSPVSPSPARASGGSLNGVAGGGGSVPWSKSYLKVLVVDDAEMNRKMLAALLTRSNISSDSVADGKLAVAVVAANEAGKLSLLIKILLTPIFVLNG